MVWWWGEGKRSILRLLLKPFLEVCPAGMTDHPKEASLRRNHWVHALRVERESIYTVAGRSVMVYRETKQTCLCLARVDVALPLSGKGGCHTDLVVDKYAQARQRQLRGKKVKPWSRQAL